MKSEELLNHPIRMNATRWFRLYWSAIITERTILDQDSLNQDTHLPFFAGEIIDRAEEAYSVENKKQ